MDDAQLLPPPPPKSQQDGTFILPPPPPKKKEEIPTVELSQKEFEAIPDIRVNENIASKAEDKTKIAFEQPLFQNPKAREAYYKRMEEKGYDVREIGERFINAKNNIGAITQSLQQNQTPELEYQAATAFLDLGKYQDAASLYSKLITDGAASPEVYQGLALTQYKLGDKRGAAELMQKAQELTMPEIASIDKPNPAQGRIKMVGEALEQFTPVYSNAKNLVKGTKSALKTIKSAKSAAEQTQGSPEMKFAAAALRGAAGAASGIINYAMNTTPIGLGFIEASQGFTGQAIGELGSKATGEYVTPEEATALLGSPISAGLEIYENKSGNKINSTIKDAVMLGELVLMGWAGHRISKGLEGKAGKENIAKAQDTANKIINGEKVAVEDLRQLNQVIYKDKSFRESAINPYNIKAHEARIKADKIAKAMQDAPATVEVLMPEMERALEEVKVNEEKAIEHDAKPAEDAAQEASLIDQKEQLTASLDVVPDDVRPLVEVKIAEIDKLLPKEVVENTEAADITKGSEGRKKVKVGDTVELPPQREGALPRKLQYTENGWMQSVGGELTNVSEGVKKQADEKFGEAKAEQPKSEPESVAAVDEVIGKIKESVKVEDEAGSGVGENPALRDAEATAKALEGKDVSALSKELGIEANWDMIGEGDALSGKDPILAYTQKQLPDWNRASQRGEVNPNSKITYDINRQAATPTKTLPSGYVLEGTPEMVNKDIAYAKDENGVTIGMAEIETLKDGRNGIKHIAVAPEFRGKGVADKLIQTLKENNPQLDLSKTKLRSKGFEKAFGNKIISEAYHKAKADGSNPELVKAVEELLGNPTESKTKQPKSEPPPETKPINKQEVKQEIIKEDEKQKEATQEGLLSKEAPPIESALASIKHADTAKVRSISGMEKYEGGYDKNVAEAKIAAKKWIANGGNVNDIVTKVREGKKIDLTESAVIGEYMQALGKAIEKESTPELLSQRAELIELLDKAGTSASEEFRGRQLMFPQEDTLANFLYDRSKDKGRELTAEEIKQEKTDYDALKAKKDELEKVLEQEREKYNRLIAEKGINQAKAIRNKQSKLTHEERVAERKKIITDAREALKKVRTGQEGVTATLPLINELKALAPFVKKALKSLVDEGVDNLDVAVTQLHADFKDIVDGLKKSDIIDILAGEHDEAKQTKAQKKNQVLLIQREARLIKELERAKKGIEKVSDVERVKKTGRIAELEKEIREVRKQNRLEETQNDEAIRDKGAKESKSPEEKLKDRIKFLEDKKKQLADDLKSGRYALEPPKQEKIKLTREARDLQDEVIALEQKIKLKRYNDQQNKIYGSTIKKVGKELLGLRRLSNTFLDWSVMGRQLAKITFNPFRYRTTARVFKAQAKSTFNPKVFDRLMNDIHKDNQYHDMVDDGVVFNDLNTIADQVRNEEYPRSFVYDIPYLKELFLASNRAADAAMNTARFEMYKNRSEFLRKQGYFRETHPELYKDLGDWVMNMTGRGKMHEAIDKGKINRVLGQTFFGLRLMASHINTLNPANYLDIKTIGENTKAVFNKKEFVKYDPVKKQAIKDIVGFTIGVTGTLLALKQAGFSVSLNPDAPDFLQARKGDKVYDVSGGLAAYVRTGLRLMEAGYARAAMGAEEANKKAEFAINSLERFLRNKLAPNTASAYNMFKGKNTIGEPFEWTEFIELYPLYFEDTYEAIQEEGISAVATTFAPNVLGIGYGSYGNKGNADFEYQNPTTYDIRNKYKNDKVKLREALINDTPEVKEVPKYVKSKVEKDEHGREVTVNLTPEQVQGLKEAKIKGIEKLMKVYDRKWTNEQFENKVNEYKTQEANKYLKTQKLK